jgi:GNAT superfamily N-acetyltransferase
MGFEIRTAVSADARAIAHVQVASWRTTYTDIVPAAFLAAMDVEQRAERWREALSLGEMLISVAEDETGIFGFVSGGKLREPIDDYDAELFAIYLLRERQGVGVGRRLFETLAQSLHAEGYRAMAVWVLKENPAVRFYEHMGGVELAHKQIVIGGASLEESAYGVKLPLPARKRSVVN